MVESGIAWAEVKGQEVAVFAKCEGGVHNFPVGSLRCLCEKATRIQDGKYWKVALDSTSAPVTESREPAGIGAGKLEVVSESRGRGRRSRGGPG
jgi:hypothetical protein